MSSISEQQVKAKKSKKASLPKRHEREAMRSESGFKYGLGTHPERQADGEAEAVLSQGLLAHVGFIDEGLPYVIPMSYQYMAEDKAVYLHGALQSRALKLLGQGQPACLEVTLLEGLVYSKAAMFHSMNYRSVLAFGKGEEVRDRDQKQRVFDAMIARMYEGRAVGQDYDAAPDEHLEITRVVKIPIEAISTKQRQGGPNGPDDRRESHPGTAGVAPIEDKPQPPAGCPFHQGAKA